MNKQIDQHNRVASPELDPISIWPRIWSLEQSSGTKIILLINGDGTTGQPFGKDKIRFKLKMNQSAKHNDVKNTSSRRKHGGITPP